MSRVSVDRKKIGAFCRKQHIHKLDVFGSVPRADFRPDSNVAVLVEFEPEHVPGPLRNRFPICHRTEDPWTG
jgi:predicted nucleotidyltransferase